MNELIELSWKSQVVLVGGYLSYVLAYSGRRASHGPTDILGIILCFGGIGLLCTVLLEAWIADLGILSHEAKSEADQDKNQSVSLRTFVIGTTSLSGPLFTAILWRGFLNDWTWKTIGNITRSKEDGLPSAWATLIQSKGLDYSQLVVTLKSGVIYESFPLGDFNKYPNGPCVFGPDGAIAMYVTYITEADGSGREVEHIHDADGYRITYIPESEISEVDFRRQRR